MNNLNAWDVLHIVNTYFYQPAMAAVDQIRTFIMIAFTNVQSYLIFCPALNIFTFLETFSSFH